MIHIVNIFKTFLSLVIFLFIVCDNATSMPIPEQVKEVVAFIYIDGPDGKRIPNGTGFFVGVKLSSEIKRFVVYLVTAQHVLKSEQEDKYFEKVYVRLNRKIGYAQFIELPLTTEGAQKNVFIPKDKSVDLAVIPFLPNQEIFKFKYLTDEMVTTKEDFNKMGISEGSEVFFTGLFTPHVKTMKNYPIVRFGKVALISEEKIDWDDTPSELYLIESSSFGGNSGSPVFYYLGAERKPGMLIVGQPVLKLAGVMKGSFNEIRPIKLVETRQTLVSTSNMGIAAVVPAYKLHKLLFNDELKNLREKLKLKKQKNE